MGNLIQKIYNTQLWATAFKMMEISPCNFCTRINCTGCAHLFQRERRQLTESDGGFNISITCHTCGVELIDMQELLEEEVVESYNQLPWCIICGQQYSDTCQHHNHFPAHFNTVSNQRFNCIECTPNAEKCILKCHLCPATLKSKQGKRFHLHRCHSDKLQYRCPLCTCTFLTGNDLKNHRKRKHKTTNLHECTVCPENLIFQTMSDKVEHIKKFHEDDGGKPTCHICHKHYASFNVLTYHMLIHKKERNFICDTCGATFLRLGHLQVHASVHETERHFTCEQCADKKFKTLLALKVHVRNVHSQNRYRFPCELCDRVFKDSTDRRRHRWTHGGFPKPHACNHCNKAFHEKKQLRTHMKSHYDIDGQIINVGGREEAQRQPHSH